MNTVKKLITSSCFILTFFNLTLHADEKLECLKVTDSADELFKKMETKYFEIQANLTLKEKLLRNLKGQEQDYPIIETMTSQSFPQINNHNGCYVKIEQFYYQNKKANKKVPKNYKIDFSKPLSKDGLSPYNVWSFSENQLTIRDWNNEIDTSIKAEGDCNGLNLALAAKNAGLNLRIFSDPKSDKCRSLTLDGNVKGQLIRNNVPAKSK